MKKNTKDVILDEAFRLFGQHTYEQVTFKELEQATKLSRGAIMYHFETKEMIFRSMCDRCLLEKTSILSIINEKLGDESYENISLKNYIDSYIDTVRELVEYGNSRNLKHIHKAIINITNQTIYYYPDFQKKSLKFKFQQIQLWKDKFMIARKKGEINDKIDLDLISETFENIYSGIVYGSIIYEDGIELLSELKKTFGLMYRLIKS